MFDDQDQLARILATARKAAGMDLHAFSVKAGYSPGHLKNVETGRRAPTPEVVEAYARALRVPLLAALWGGDEMQRKAILTALVAVGAIGTVSPATLAEIMRIAVLRNAGVAADWREIMTEVAHRFIAEPAAQMQTLIDQHIYVLAGERELNAAQLDTAARLMLLRGNISANLGDQHAARQWYSTACQLARRSNDPNLITWIYGRLAFRRSFEKASTAAIVELTEGIESAAAHLARAHMLARDGYRTAALAAVDSAQRAYPHDRPDDETIIGFQPYRLTLSIALVHAYLGDVAATEAALSQVSVPEALIRFRAQRDLVMPVALARAGDRFTAAAMRDQVWLSHPAEQTSQILTTMNMEIGP